MQACIKADYHDHEFVRIMINIDMSISAKRDLGMLLFMIASGALVNSACDGPRNQSRISEPAPCMLNLILYILVFFTDIPAFVRFLYTGTLCSECNSHIRAYSLLTGR